MGGRSQQTNSGIELVLEKYRRQFRIAENLNYYSEAHYKIAERKFIKFALSFGESKDSEE